MTAPPPLTAAALVNNAWSMLDEETHRYVERFTDCPNGCRFEYGKDVAVPLARIAGPVDCDRCDLGQVEDEYAEHLNPFLEQLRQLAERLAAAERALGDLCVEDWPEHMTCGEAEDLATVLTAFDPDVAGDLVAAHAGGDDDPADVHHGGEAVSPA